MRSDSKGTIKLVVPVIIDYQIRLTAGEFSHNVESRKTIGRRHPEIDDFDFFLGKDCSQPIEKIGREGTVIIVRISDRCRAAQTENAIHSLWFWHLKIRGRRSGGKVCRSKIAEFNIGVHLIICLTADFTTFEEGNIVAVVEPAQSKFQANEKSNRKQNRDRKKDASLERSQDVRRGFSFLHCFAIVDLSTVEEQREALLQILSISKEHSTGTVHRSKNHTGDCQHKSKNPGEKETTVVKNNRPTVGEK